MSVPMFYWNNILNYNRGQRRYGMLWGLDNLSLPDLKEAYGILRYKYPALHRDEQAIVNAMAIKLQRAGMLQEQQWYNAVGVGAFFDADEGFTPAGTGSGSSGSGSSSPGFWDTKAGKCLTDPSCMMNLFNQGLDTVKKTMCMGDPNLEMCKSGTKVAPPTSFTDLCNKYPQTAACIKARGGVVPGTATATSGQSSNTGILLGLGLAALVLMAKG